jgi:DNA-binding NarL/FixJ family response regulator
LIRVLLVDDDPLVRAGLKMMLRGADDIEIVGEVDDGSGVAAAVRRHAPDVVLMDIRMPVMDGIAATRTLTGTVTAPAVIVLTTFDADRIVLDAMRAGAAGYLLKHTEPEQIVQAVRSAARGEPALSPAAARALFDHAAAGSGTRAEQAARRFALLSERERTIAIAVACLPSGTPDRRAVFPCGRPEVGSPRESRRPGPDHPERPPYRACQPAPCFRQPPERRPQPGHPRPR